MSFDINPSKNLSNVQASHKSTDGGAGNTGYFQREQKEEVSLEFAKDYPKDTFIKAEDIVLEEQETDSLFDLIKKLFKELIKAVKKLLKK